MEKKLYVAVSKSIQILAVIIRLEVEVATVGDEKVFYLFFKELSGLVTGILRAKAAWWLVD